MLLQFLICEALFWSNAYFRRHRPKKMWFCTRKATIIRAVHELSSFYIFSFTFINERRNIADSDDSAWAWDTNFTETAPHLLFSINTTMPRKFIQVYYLSTRLDYLNADHFSSQDCGMWMYCCTFYFQVLIWTSSSSVPRHAFLRKRTMCVCRQFTWWRMWSPLLHSSTWHSSPTLSWLPSVRCSTCTYFLPLNRELAAYLMKTVQF